MREQVFCRKQPNSSKIVKQFNVSVLVLDRRLSKFGHKDCKSNSMFKKELKTKIEKLEQELSTKEKEYLDAVRSHKDYNTLRSIRDNIGELKANLKSLHDASNEPDSNIKL